MASGETSRENNHGVRSKPQKQPPSVRKMAISLGNGDACFWEFVMRVSTVYPSGLARTAKPVNHVTGRTKNFIFEPSSPLTRSAARGKFLRSLPPGRARRDDSV